MPGKPQRQRTLQRLVGAFPQQERLSNIGQAALNRAASQGIAHRLARTAPKEAEAVRESIQFWSAMFPWLIKLVGLEKAEGIVTAWMVKVSLKQMNQVKKSMDPTSLRLLFEYGALVDGLPSRHKDPQGRKAWLKQRGIDAGLLDQVWYSSDADMAEDVLASRHNKSRSYIQKQLAKAHQIISSGLNSPRNKKSR